MLEAIFLVALGIVLCFAGYRLFHAVLPLTGFLLFYLAAWSHLRVATGGELPTLLLGSLFAGVVTFLTRDTPACR